MKMRKNLSLLLVTSLGLALLIYSAARSLDFIGMTLPPDKQVLAWFGLAALDGGLVLWLLHYLYSARGAWQRGIALLMVVIDFLGAAAMFTLDTLYRTGEAGITTALSAPAIRGAVLALSGVIALNIAATVANHILDPDSRRQAAAQEAEDEIEEAAIKTISEHAPALAAELAPTLAADYLARTRARYLALLGDGGGMIDGKLTDPKPAAERQPTTPPAFVPKTPATNGNGRTYASEAQAGAELAPSPKAPAAEDKPSR